MVHSEEVESEEAEIDNVQGEHIFLLFSFSFSLSPFLFFSALLFSMIKNKSMLQEFEIIKTDRCSLSEPLFPQKCQNQRRDF